MIQIKKRKLWKVILAGLILWGGAFLWSPGAQAQVHPVETCLVMPGHKINKKFFADYEGKRIFFCCRSCVKAFKRNPQKYGVVGGQH